MFVNKIKEKTTNLLETVCAILFNTSSCLLCDRLTAARCWAANMGANRFVAIVSITFREFYPQQLNHGCSAPQRAALTKDTRWSMDATLLSQTNLAVAATICQGMRVSSPMGRNWPYRRKNVSQNCCHISCRCSAASVPSSLPGHSLDISQMRAWSANFKNQLLIILAGSHPFGNHFSFNICSRTLLYNHRISMTNVWL